jgi:hypothetical protein
MKNILATVLILLFPILHLSAQDQNTSSDVVQIIDFHTSPTNAGTQFVPDLPPLTGLAGAPPPFYEYFWIFGDGSFSREESPIHVYDQAGSYDAYLLATGNYDKGKKPKKKGKKVELMASTSPSQEAFPNVIKEQVKKIGIAAARNPSPEEETIIIISYRNNTPDYQYGKLHLFFNEKRFPTTHFNYQESLMYFGEEEEQPALSSILFYPYEEKKAMASLDDWVPKKSAFLDAPRVREQALNETLEEAKNEFHEQRSWSYYNLAPGETRNLFVSLGATPEMVKDTAVTIFLQSVLESNDGRLLDEARLEIEIVAAHDPNIISVSDRKVGFRGIRRNQLQYKVQFQNTGEGPAGTIEITTSIPKGLDMEKVEVLGNYPECPICPEEPVDWSCMDTIFREKELLFVFKNVYLPGTKQQGVNDRDSTKGFVSYRIFPSKKMKKRPFRSQASIVFDQEEPVVTNWARTRYKFEPSLGVQLGYRFFPDQENIIGGENNNQLHSFFLGFSLSDYKAFKMYLQPEIRTGLSEKLETSVILPPEQRSDTVAVVGADRFIVFDSITRFSGMGTRQRFSVELVPLQLRKNLSDFFALGVGATYLLTFERRENDLQTTSQYFRSTLVRFVNADGTVGIRREGDPEQIGEDSGTLNEAQTSTWGRLGLFVDIGIGLVRAGPSLGLRNHFRFGDQTRYAAEVYATWKF